MEKKIEILARLLKEDKITIEEFIILMEVQYIYKDEISLDSLNWEQPLSPYIHQTTNPYTVDCNLVNELLK